jgi:PBP1b-binding outer membrane lipoprotein LpoB
MKRILAALAMVLALAGCAQQQTQTEEAEEQVWEVFRRDPEAPAAEQLRES